MSDQNVVTKQGEALKELGKRLRDRVESVTKRHLTEWLEAGCPGQAGHYPLDEIEAWVRAHALAPDGDRDDDQPEAPADEPPRRQTAAPDCPYCKRPCLARSTDAFFTRYYCRTPACSYSEKVARPNMQARIARARRDETDFSAR